MQILGMILGIVMSILGAFLGGGQMGGMPQGLGPNAPAPTAGPAGAPLPGGAPLAPAAPGQTPVNTPVNASFAPAGTNGQTPAAAATGPGDTQSEQGRRALISQALQLSQVAPVTEENIAAVNLIVEKESSWNPDAQNNTDSNAQRGTPSQGLMQTIPTTFQENALPGYDQNIRDPLSNLIAGIRYAVKRYGSLQNVPGVAAVARGEAYRGY